MHPLSNRPAGRALLGRFSHGGVDAARALATLAASAAFTASTAFRAIAALVTLCLLLVTGLPARAAPRLPPTLQAELDAAVADHYAGRTAQALEAMESLSRRGVPAADYNLGLLHLKREHPQADRDTAERLLLRAAEAGFVTAQSLLGQAYETGQIGKPPRDLVRAHDWYERAALAGSVDAQVAMGTAHYLGRGRAKDPTRALQWYRAAATGGDVGAMYLTASMYEQGDGAGRDLRLARYWYERAAEAGDEAAPGKLKEVESKLAADAGI